MIQDHLEVCSLHQLVYPGFWNNNQSFKMHSVFQFSILIYITIRFHYYEKVISTAFDLSVIVGVNSACSTLFAPENKRIQQFLTGKNTELPISIEENDYILFRILSKPFIYEVYSKSHLKQLGTPTLFHEKKCEMEKIEQLGFSFIF